MKTEQYCVHQRVVQGNTYFMIQHNLRKEASLMGKFYFCEDSWISTVQNLWQTLVKELLYSKKILTL